MQRTIYSPAQVTTYIGQRIGSNKICAVIFSDWGKQDFYKIAMYLTFYHTAWVITKSYIELKNITKLLRKTVPTASNYLKCN